MRRRVSRSSVEAAPCLVALPTSSLSNTQKTGTQEAGLLCEEALKGSEHAGQIVELLARDIFLLRAENRARLTDVEG